MSDLTLISKVSNEAINDNLKKRFENREIYVSTPHNQPSNGAISRGFFKVLICEQTYIGHVLVSVNPFQDCKYTLEEKRASANFLSSGNLHRHSPGQL